MSDIPRDAKGHFLKGAGTPWTPEQARENAKKGQAALQAKNSEATRESADRILREDAKMEGGWDAASEGMRKLALDVARGGSGSVQSFRLLLSQTGGIVKSEKTDAPGQNWNPESGDPCPLCSANRVTLMVDADVGSDVEKIIDDKAPVEAGPIVVMES